MIIFFSFAGSDIGKRSQNPGLKQEFGNNAELLFYKHVFTCVCLGSPIVNP